MFSPTTALISLGKMRSLVFLMGISMASSDDATEQVILFNDMMATIIIIITKSTEEIIMMYQQLMFDLKCQESKYFSFF